MDKLLSPFHQSKLLNTLFLSNIFLSFHYALIIYINSSLLSGFFSDTQVSTLYIIASIFDMIFLLSASKIIEKVGVYKFITGLLCLEFIATIGMGTSSNPILVGICFIIHTVAISLALFNMDIFVENVSKNESLTGSIRATYLTTTNVTVILAPALVAFVIMDHLYSYVYVVSSLFVIPVYFLIKRFKKVEAKPITHIRIKETLTEYIRDKNLSNIFASEFLLQLFYAFMVVYTPLYLEKYMGFAWTEIGIMFTIMLLPFILFELPIGELEDGIYTEKEFLTIGFVIMGLSTLFISFITLKSFWVWTTVLFITRIGASFVEVSTESYFFKHVNGEKSDIIGFFRVGRPVAFIVAPVLATLALQFIPFQYVFIIMGSLMILGAHYSLSLQNTKNI